MHIIKIPVNGIFDSFLRHQSVNRLLGIVLGTRTTNVIGLAAVVKDQPMNALAQLDDTRRGQRLKRKSFACWKTPSLAVYYFSGLEKYPEYFGSRGTLLLSSVLFNLKKSILHEIIKGNLCVMPT